MTKTNRLLQSRFLQKPFLLNLLMARSDELGQSNALLNLVNCSKNFSFTVLLVNLPYFMSLSRITRYKYNGSYCVLFLVGETSLIISLSRIRSNASSYVT